MRPALLLLLLPLALASVAHRLEDPAPAPRRELSFWVHCTLPDSWRRGYWESAHDAAPAQAASLAEVRRAARLLTETYHANTLYLLYHHEVDWAVAAPLFRAWRASMPAGTELVPTLLFRTYNATEGIAPFGGRLNFDAARSNATLNASERRARMVDRPPLRMPLQLRMLHCSVRH
jgi:hypothetical protein